MRSRFRGDDRSHASALLELATHEILRAVAKDVQVSPDFNGGHPDFSATYGNTGLIVECTVAQGSDKKFGALQREKVVLDTINSIQAGPFGLKLETRSVGETQPPIRQFRSFLENWLASLTRVVDFQAVTRGTPLDTREWKWQDWELRFEAIPLGFPVEGGSLGIVQWPVQTIVGKVTIGRALDKKAEKYRHPRVPYLIVVAERESMAGPEIILDALLGPMSVIFGPNDQRQTRAFNGLWGSPSHPRSRHVSAVLYKHKMRDAWSICSQISATDYFDNTPRTIPSWQLVHNPAADMPLPRRMFPFATEHVWLSEHLTQIAPTRILNEILGLPNPWPGEEH